jgi:hypothetical protein
VPRPGAGHRFRVRRRPQAAAQSEMIVAALSFLE